MKQLKNPYLRLEALGTTETPSLGPPTDAGDTDTAAVAIAVTVSLSLRSLRGRGMDDVEAAALRVQHVRVFKRHNNHTRDAGLPATTRW
jgi:hypothetical protein